MEGTINGTLPDFAATEPSVPEAPKTRFWKRRKSLSYRAIAGLLLAAAFAGGAMEKSGMDDQIKDLQAQVAEMQDTSSTGAAGLLSGSGTLVSKKANGSNNVKHPKALSPSQHKYQCTKIG